MSVGRRRKFWVNIRNRTSNLCIPRSDALLLSHRDSMVSKAYYEAHMTRILHTDKTKNIFLSLEMLREIKPLKDSYSLFWQSSFTVPMAPINTLKVGIKRHVMSSSCISQHSYPSPKVLILQLSIYEFPSQITKPLNFSFIMCFFYLSIVKLNPCDKKPCLNGGECSAGIIHHYNHTCKCPPLFTGRNCESKFIVFSLSCENK